MRRLAAVAGHGAATAGLALADAKFLVPAPGPDVVHRERVTALIEGATGRPVTVITAPAGAGKTVACAGWTARAGSRRVAWLGLDEEDQEPGRFRADVAAALAAGGAVDAVPPVQRGRDPAGELAAVLRRLTGPAVLVLDDVHLLAGSRALPGLAQLIRRAPAALRLILCGRFDPGLQLARMRLSGGLSEVRAAELACTPEEADSYLAALGMVAEPARRDALLRATEGWMAGPRLAALIAARDGDVDIDTVATDPVVADYLREEVLLRQPPGVRQFLRRTSIVVRLTPDLAELLTGEPASARVLDTLNRENDLVERDHQGGYRYHPFLRQVLLSELRGELAAEVPALFSRASQWAAGQGDVIEAVRCAAEAAGWDAVPHVLTRAGLAGALPGRAEELEAVLGRLPAQRRADPAVAAALAMARLCRGDAESAAAYGDLAAFGLGAGVPDRLVTELWVATARVAARQGAGPAASCLPLAERAGASASRQPEHQALGLLWLALGTTALSRGATADAVTALTAAEQQLTAAGTGPLAERTRGWLALAVAIGGDLVAAAGLSGRLRDVAEPDSAAACLAAVAAAQVAVDRDDPLQARRLLDDTDPATVRPLPGEPDIGALLTISRARAALAEGDPVRAGDLARLVREKYEQVGPLLAALDVDIALRAGDLARAETVLGLPEGPGKRPDLAAARARLLLADGDPASALGLALTVARKGGEAAAAGLRPTLRDRVTALLTGAVAARRTGREDQAAGLLQEALANAEPHGLYRPFLDGGAAVHSAAAGLIAPSSPAAGFAARVHDHFVRQPSSPRAAAGRPDAAQAPALTTSELAVLRLLRSYLSNQDIADTLFLSVNTVKTHLRSVYSKLGVSSRREAVEVGARLRLL